MTTTTTDLKKLYRETVTLIHPDYFPNASVKEKARLTECLQDLNAAFAAKDEAAMRAVLLPKAPPPPQPPPNAWGPRTYSGAQQPAQAPPQAQQQQAQPSGYTAPAPLGTKFWFWLTWFLWSMPCIVIGAQHGASATLTNDMWFLFFPIGPLVSLLIAHSRTQIRQQFQALWGTGFPTGTPPLVRMSGFMFMFLAGVAAIVIVATRQSIAVVKTFLKVRRSKFARTVLATVIVIVGVAIVSMISDPSSRLHRAVPHLAGLHDGYKDHPSIAVRVMKPGDKVEVGGDLESTTPGSINLTADQVENPDGATNSKERKAIERAVDSDPAVPGDAIMCINPATLVYAFALDIDGKATCSDPKAVLIEKSSSTNSNLLRLHATNGGWPAHYTVLPTAAVPEYAKQAAAAAPIVAPTVEPASVVEKPISLAPKPDSKPATVPQAYVDYIKQWVAFYWKSDEVLDSTPAGATVYVQFVVGTQGDVSDTKLATSSGYDSLDQSCLHAVQRLTKLAPLPDEHPENTLNVLYHCTYPGRPSNSITALPPSASAPAPIKVDYSTLRQAVFSELNGVWVKATEIPAPFGARASIRFVIGNNGTLTQAYVERTSGYPALDKECLRVVNTTPIARLAGYTGGSWESFTCEVYTFQSVPVAPVAPVVAVESHVSRSPKDFKGTYSGSVAGTPAVLVLQPARDGFKGCFEITGGEPLKVTGQFAEGNADSITLSAGKSGGTKSSYMLHSYGIRSSSSFSGSVTIQPSGAVEKFDFTQVGNHTQKCK